MVESATGHDLIGDLRREIARGRMLVVVGAGVSIGASGRRDLASWTGLLRDGARRCVEVAGPLPAGWQERVLAEIDSGDLDELLSAAEKISRKLDAPAGRQYARWLRDTVGRLRVAEPSVIEAIRDLGLPLATTNYDGLLEEVTGLPPVTWREGERVERVIRGDEPAVLHLHGYWEDPESVVLGIRSYEQVLGDAHAQTMLRAIRATRGLLFVGCGAGIADPDFDALLRWTRTVFEGDGYRHFQLCLEGEVAELERLHPAEERLSALPYGPEHSCLAPFLRDLAPPPGAAPAGEEEAAIGLATGAPGLPDPPLCFGRDAEIGELAAALDVEVPQPIPVLGTPGIGKTTVLLNVLHDRRLARAFGERRWYVSCAEAASRADVAAAIARSLKSGVGMREDGAQLSAPAGRVMSTARSAPPLPTAEGGERREEGIAAELARAPGLLVLDHAEAPWDADPLGLEGLLACLAAVPRLSLVVSLRGEERPLGPPWRDAVRIGPLPLAAARDQLLAIAGERFRRDPDLDPLLEAVDRQPRAVELLARRAEAEKDLAALRRRWAERWEETIREEERRPGKIEVCRMLLQPAPSASGEKSDSTGNPSRRRRT